MQMPKRNNSQNEVNPSHPSPPPASRATGVRAVPHITLKGAALWRGRAPRPAGTPGSPAGVRGPEPVPPQGSQRCDDGTAPARCPAGGGAPRRKQDCELARLFHTGTGEPASPACSCPRSADRGTDFSPGSFQEAWGSPLEMSCLREGRGTAIGSNLVSSVGSE